MGLLNEFDFENDARLSLVDEKEFFKELDVEKDKDDEQTEKE